MIRRRITVPHIDEAEQALVADPARLRQLFANMTEGFAFGEPIVDASGRPVDFRLLEVNEAFFTHTGLPRDILGRPAREYVPQLEASWVAQFGAVALDGQPRRFSEYNADTGRHYEVYAFSPLPGRFAFFFQDVSERLQMERALAENEAWLRQLLASLPVLVWTADADGRGSYYSPQWAAYAGREPESLRGEGWLTVIHPDDRAPLLAAWQAALAGTAPYLVEARLRRHDGAYRWFSVRGTPLEGPDGRLQRWFGTCTDIHELKLSEQARAEAERRYTALFNNRVNGISHLRVVTDGAGRPVDLIYEDVNRAYEEQLGRRREQVLGRGLTEVFPGIETMQPDLLRLYGGIALEGGEHDGEYFFPVTRQWFSTYAYSHAPGKCTLIFSDITAQKEAAEALRQSEKTLSAAFDQAAVGMAYTAADGHWQRVNRKYCDMLGYSEDELRGLTYSDLTHPADQAVTQAVAARLEQGTADTVTFEKRYLHRDGHSVWMRVTVTAVRDEEGRRDCHFVIAEDITARKAAEQARDAAAAALQEAHQALEARVQARTAELEAANAALARAEARSRLVLETTADAYVATDDSGCITEWNRAAAALFGWSQAEAVGQSLTLIIPPRYRDEHERSFRRFTVTGESEVMGHVLALPALARDGRELPVELSLTANRIEGRWMISAFIRDVSERKRHEAALEAASRAAEEARANAEAALRQAEAANAAKSEFLATMSHEIRTPLNGVIGFNGLLLDGELTEAKRRYVELARQSGETLLRLLNDFLDFSKIEAGHLTLEPMEFGLHQEISHLMTLVQDSAEQKGLALSLHLDAPDALRGDAARLRQILLNLVSNAIKFTAQGRVSLCCEEILRQGRRTWLCFRVSDTGIGIDAAAGARLFQPFVQADASTTRRFGGTGLGLAISRRVAEAMGGTIGFRSRPGQGATFWVKLPFELLEQNAAPVHVDEAAAPAPAPEVTLRGRALVAEDNPVSQLLAVEILKRLGCQADVVGNGEEAVAAWRQLPYDLIFMDCDMPVLNGFDATRAIRAQEQADARGDAPARIPIIAMTASALQGDPEKCLAAGMDDFMAKPLRLDQFARQVDKWLRPRREQGSQQ